eukprot:7749966-Pyramimonas_sp.AAC.1
MEGPFRGCIGPSADPHCRFLEVPWESRVCLFDEDFFLRQWSELICAENGCVNVPRQLQTSNVELHYAEGNRGPQMAKVRSYNLAANRTCGKAFETGCIPSGWTNLWQFDGQQVSADLASQPSDGPTWGPPC